MLTAPNMSRESRDNANQLCWKTASALINSRTNGMRRTCFSIGPYLFQVIAAFVPEIRDVSSPSGGRIRHVNTILLAIADYPAEQCNWRLHLPQQMPLDHIESHGSHRVIDPSGRKLFRKRQTTTLYLDSLPCSSTIFSLRQEKRLFNVGTERHWHYHLALNLHHTCDTILYNSFQRLVDKSP